MLPCTPQLKACRPTPRIHPSSKVPPALTAWQPQSPLHASQLQWRAGRSCLPPQGCWCHRRTRHHEAGHRRQPVHPRLPLAQPPSLALLRAPQWHRSRWHKRCPAAADAEGEGSRPKVITSSQLCIAAALSSTEVHNRQAEWQCGTIPVCRSLQALVHAHQSSHGAAAGRQWHLWGEQWQQIMGLNQGCSGSILARRRHHRLCDTL